MLFEQSCAHKTKNNESKTEDHNHNQETFECRTTRRAPKREHDMMFMWLLMMLTTMIMVTLVLQM